MRPAEIQRTLLEALAVAVIGAGVALAANAVSPRGLALTRDYFPKSTKETPARVVAATNASAQPLGKVSGADGAPLSRGATNDEVALRLKGKGLAGIGRDETEKLLGAARVVFVDARGVEKFEEGHLAGAYQLDPYHPERTFGAVLPACLTAEKVVVYCAGGECEDADTVAIMLRDAGVPADKLFVYGGGMTEWMEQRQPVETGARHE